MTFTTTNLNDVNLPAVGELVSAIQADPGKAHTRWHATITWDGGFRSHAEVRELTPIVSDEPEGLGGTDTAPNPVEQVIAALGNCLAVGYAAGATARGIELRDLRVDVEGDLDLRTFLGLDPDGNAGYSQIRVQVHIDSDADPEALAELHDQVVATSPVGHTLTRSIPVDVRLV